MEKKEVVSTDKFHRYVPGRRGETHEFSENPDSLKLDSYLLPPIMDEVPTPVLDDHAFGVIDGDFSSIKIESAKIDGEKLYAGYYKNRSVAIVPRGQMASYKWYMQSCDIGVSNTALFLPKLVLDRMVVENLGVDPDQVELIPKMGIEDYLIYEMAQQLKASVASPSALSKVYMESATQFLAAHVLKNYCAQDYKIREYKRGLDKRTLARITDYINQNLDRAVSLQDLAALSKVSGYHFIRLFKNSTGYSPYQYVIHCRIEKAKDLLGKTKLSITDIAFDVGFDDISNFSRTFRKFTGFSPSMYRRSANG